MKNILLCANENQEKYLYQYDSEYQIGIKVTFLNQNTESVTDKITETLSKQYIQKILYT